MVFVKQYGEMHTGTNLVRALLDSYFQDVTVLMHCLGDKHSEPSSILLDETIDQSQIRAATLQHPAATTDPECRKQSMFIDAVSNSLVRAIQNGELLFVINVRCPFSWTASHLHWSGFWPRRKKPTVNRKTIEHDLTKAFRCFNRRYESWLMLKKRFPERTLIVQHHELISDQQSLVSNLSKLPRLTRNNVDFREISGIALPTHWDHDPVQIHHVEIDRRRYIEGRVTEHLDDWVIDFVNDLVNWTTINSTCVFFAGEGQSNLSYQHNNNQYRMNCGYPQD